MCTSYVCVLLLSVGLACSTVAAAGQGPGSPSSSAKPISAQLSSIGAQYCRQTIGKAEFRIRQQLIRQQRGSLVDAYVQPGCTCAVHVCTVQQPTRDLITAVQALLQQAKA